jgi:hypothetical protein
MDVLAFDRACLRIELRPGAAGLIDAQEFGRIASVKLARVVGGGLSWTPGSASSFCSSVVRQLRGEAVEGDAVAVVHLVRRNRRSDVRRLGVEVGKVGLNVPALMSSLAPAAGLVAGKPATVPSYVAAGASASSTM